MKHKEFVHAMQQRSAEFFGDKAGKPKYILADRDLWADNILLPEVAEYVAKAKEEVRGDHSFPLHKWIHHGLSSQACCFNLFGPLVAGKKQYDIVSDLLRMADPAIELAGKVQGVSFEHENRDALGESSGQPTSVDVYIESDAGERVLVEFKFTETEFGTCSVYEQGDCDGANPWKDLDSCYLHKDKARKYMYLMRRYGLLPQTESCPFSEFYQAYRLLLLALAEEEKYGGRSSVLVVHDERNPAFLRVDKKPPTGKYVRFKNLLTAETANRVSILSIQQAVAALSNADQGEWVSKFCRRYGL